MIRLETVAVTFNAGTVNEVQALRGLNFGTIATGDSYNDTAMLAEADAGILYRPPENVVREFPQFPVARSYDELRAALEHAAEELA